ncbi:Protein kinase-like domain [Phytophthora cactorum]|nr:Protein kinase-like domain [Phytophthora cactorum]
MHRSNVVPDLSFLPVVCYWVQLLCPYTHADSCALQPTQQQLQNMIAYVQIQKELRKLPRVDGTGPSDCSGVNIQLAVLKKNPHAPGGVDGGSSLLFRLPHSLFQNGRLNLLQGGWPQGYSLRLLIKELCSRIDGSTNGPSVCAPVQPLYDVNAPLPAPSAPTLYSEKPGKDNLLHLTTERLCIDDSRQMLFRCKWKDTAKQFPVPMIQTLLELRQVIEPHLPAAMHPGVSLKLLKRMCDGCVPATYPLCIFFFKGAYLHNCREAEEQKAPGSNATVDLLGLNRLSPKKPHEAVPGSPTRIQLSAPTRVGSVDLLGLNQQSPKTPLQVFSPPSPARHVLRSPSLGKILKTGCTVREVEWKDLAIQKQIGTGSSCQVYKGSWRGAEVAVKSFTGMDHSAVEREFANEVDMMQQLGPNPSLVLLLAVCANPLSLVLEYLPFSLLYVPLRFLQVVRCSELINGVPDKTRRIPPFPASWTKRVHMMVRLKQPRYHKPLTFTACACTDFGISRSNDQSELMTGCCGTFQWMAPYVQNQS